MAKIHGKNGVLYMGETTAVRIAELTTWSVDVGRALSEDTAFEAAWKEQLAGVNEWSGKLEGFYDDATDALFAAATSSTIQKLYLYPSNAASTKYFYGTAYPDFSIEVGVGDVVKISGGFSGSGTLAKK